MVTVTFFTTLCTSCQSQLSGVEVMSKLSISVYWCIVKFSARRIVQIFNLSSLGNDCGISRNTTKSWLSIPDFSFLVFLLQNSLLKQQQAYGEATEIISLQSRPCCLLQSTERKAQLTTQYLKGGFLKPWLCSIWSNSAFTGISPPTSISNVTIEVMKSIVYGD